MRTVSFIVGLLVLVISVGVSAHHAFTAEFDANQPVNLDGSIVRVDWVNPHAWIFMKVQRSDGSTENWEIEMGTPNALFRNGVTKNVLMPGVQILVSGFRARDGSTKANGRNITFKDGRSLFIGGAGAGAPPGEAEKK
jgi:hypothetical protein